MDASRLWTFPFKSCLSSKGMKSREGQSREKILLFYRWMHPASYQRAVERSAWRGSSLAVGTLPDVWEEVDHHCFDVKTCWCQHHSAKALIILGCWHTWGTLLWCHFFPAFNQMLWRMLSLHICFTVGFSGVGTAHAPSCSGIFSGMLICLTCCS